MAERASHVFWVSHKDSRQVAEVRGKKSAGVKRHYTNDLKKSSSFNSKDIKKEVTV